MSKWFVRFSDRTTDLFASPWATLAAILVVVVWAVAGPFLGFSDAWLLAINTVTTIITFLLVFIILSSQNRSDKATHLKLDEIISWMEALEPEEAIGAEKKTESEIDEMRAKVHQARTNGC